jgi:nitrogen fixation NifU-like protein
LDLRELYQEMILDHGRRPRNFGLLEEATSRAEGHNPLCGDRLQLHVRVEDGVVRDVAFEGAGCAISVASASLMTQAVKGMPVDEAERLFRSFHSLVAGEPSGDGNGADLGKLEVFTGVRAFPTRVKCATLAWHTLHAALTDPDASVTTE